MPAHATGVDIGVVLHHASDRRDPGDAHVIGDTVLLRRA